MKATIYVLVLSTLLFTVACTRYSGDSPQSKPIDRPSAAAPGDEASIATTGEGIPLSSAGEVISNEEAKHFTSSFSESMNGARRFYFEAEALQDALASDNVGGIWFAISRPGSGGYSLVAIPASLNGTMMPETGLAAVVVTGATKSLADISNEEWNVEEVKSATANDTHEWKGIRRVLISKEVIREVIDGNLGLFVYPGSYKSGSKAGRFTLVGMGATQDGDTIQDGVDGGFQRGATCPTVCG